MPEHVHLLVLPLDENSNVSRLLARIKQPFSKQIKQILTDARSRLLTTLTVRERPGRHCFRFWQEGLGFDRNLFHADAVEASIQYIHHNPVARKLSRQGIDWKWSSARFYFTDLLDEKILRLTKPPTQVFDRSGVQIEH